MGNLEFGGGRKPPHRKKHGASRYQARLPITVPSCRIPSFRNSKNLHASAATGTYGAVPVVLALYMLTKRQLLLHINQWFWVQLWFYFKGGRGRLQRKQN